MLKPVERGVIEHVAAGEPNKVIAIDLDLHPSVVGRQYHCARDAQLGIIAAFTSSRWRDCSRVRDDEVAFQPRPGIAKVDEGVVGWDRVPDDRARAG